MAKKINNDEKAVKVTTSGQFAIVGPKQDGSKRESVGGSSFPSTPKRDKSYTFHGDSKITTSGVPIKSR